MGMGMAARLRGRRVAVGLLLLAAACALAFPALGDVGAAPHHDHQQQQQLREQALIVCDLAHGRPAFPELQSLWLLLAAGLAARGHNVTLLPLADAKTDFAAEYFVELKDMVEALEPPSSTSSPAGEGLWLRPSLDFVPVYHHFSSPSRSIQRSYTLYTYLKENEGSFGTVYHTDFGGAAYYSLLAKSSGLFFGGTSFVAARVGTRTAFAGLRGLTATADLLASLDDVQAAYMEEQVGALQPLHHGGEDRMGGSLDPSSVFRDGWRGLVPGFETLQSPPVAERAEAEFVYVGSFTQADGVDLFMRAVEKLCGHALRGGGDGEEGAAAPGVIRVTFLGRATFFSEKAGLSKRKRASQSDVVQFFADWTERMGAAHGGRVEVSVHSAGLEQQLSYFGQRAGALAVLCDANAKQRFLLGALRAAGARVMLPSAEPGSVTSAGDNGAGGCGYKPTSSGLYRAMRRLLEDPSELEGCRSRPALNTTEGAAPESHPQEMVMDWGVGASVATRRGESAKDGGGVEPGDGGDEEGVLVTCVVTHYNRGQFLLQAVSSLLAQSHGNIEVIVVDDGSTCQESIEILGGLEAEHAGNCREGRRDSDGDGPCVRVERVANNYLGAARNVGLAAASGAFVLFMDDDNYAKPDEVASFLKAMLRTGADIAVCASECVLFPILN